VRCANRLVAFDGPRASARWRRASSSSGPVPSDCRAHGRFDARGRGKSVQVRLDRHRGWIAAGIGLAADAALALLAGPGSRRLLSA
jgi:hypothetical protein